MVKNIIKDEEFLKRVSVDCSQSDSSLFIDLRDTLELNRKCCVGMAANMIGVSKNAIVFINEDEKLEIMVNPIIVKKEGEYKAKEGCLSLLGQRECIRYQKIKVEYLTTDFKKRIKTYTGFTAEIIQHEIDHLHGIII